MIFLCSCNNIIDKSIYRKDVVPVVGPIVVIVLFIIDRILGFYLRKREIERNWYLKVLIEPSISKISAFYKSATDGYKVSAGLLQSNKQQPHLGIF